MKIPFQYISAFLLLTLILIKVSNFHAYSHTDGFDENQIENCSGCELAVENQDTALLIAPIVEMPVAISIGHTQQHQKVSTEILVFQLDYALFSRPPPTLA